MTRRSSWLSGFDCGEVTTMQCFIGFGFRAAFDVRGQRRTTTERLLR